MSARVISLQGPALPAKELTRDKMGSLRRPTATRPLPDPPPEFFGDRGKLRRSDFFAYSAKILFNKAVSFFRRYLGSKQNAIERVDEGQFETGNDFRNLSRSGTIPEQTSSTTGRSEELAGERVRTGKLRKQRQASEQGQRISRLGGRVERRIQTEIEQHIRFVRNRRRRFQKVFQKRFFGGRNGDYRQKKKRIPASSFA